MYTLQLVTGKHRMLYYSRAKHQCQLSRIAEHGHRGHASRQNTFRDAKMRGSRAKKNEEPATKEHQVICWKERTTSRRMRKRGGTDAWNDCRIPSPRVMVEDLDRELEIPSGLGCPTPLFRSSLEAVFFVCVFLDPFWVWGTIWGARWSQA